MIIPKIGTPNVAELALPEITMMSDETFRMDDYDTEREDLGYLAGQVSYDSRTPDYGSSNSSYNSSHKDVRDTRTQSSRTEGDNAHRSQTLDKSDSGARSEASEDRGGSTSPSVDAGKSPVMDRMSEFQAIVKKMSQGKNIGPVDKDGKSIQALKKTTGKEGSDSSRGAETIQGEEAAQDAAKRQMQHTATNKTSAAEATSAIRNASQAAQTSQLNTESMASGKASTQLLMEPQKNVAPSTSNAPVKIPLAQLSDSSELRDLIQNLKQGEGKDAILRIEDTEAGTLEVHIRMNGADLAVQVRAEDMGLRNRMLEKISDVENALAKEGIVDGKVTVSEFDAGTSDRGTSSSQNGGEEHENMNQNFQGKGGHSQMNDGDKNTLNSTHQGLVHILA